MNDFTERPESPYFEDDIEDRYLYPGEGEAELNQEEMENMGMSGEAAGTQPPLDVSELIRNMQLDGEATGTQIGEIVDLVLEPEARYSYSVSFFRLSDDVPLPNGWGPTE